MKEEKSWRGKSITLICDRPFHLSTDGSKGEILREAQETGRESGKWFLRGGGYRGETW